MSIWGCGKLTDMPSKPRPYVRQMPRIYGNLQPVAHPGARWIPVAAKVAVVFGAAGYCLYLLFIGPLFRVHEVTVSGTVFSSRQRVEASILPNTNIWLVSASNIRSRIMSDPSVQSIAVLRGLPHTVKIEVTEQPVSALWQSGDAIALVNAQGAVFKLLPANELDGLTLSQIRATVPLIVDAHALPVSVGEYLLSPQFISFATKVQSGLPSLANLHPEHFSVVNSTYAVTLITIEGPQIQLSSLNDPDVQMHNIKRLMKQEKLTAAARIDLRVNRWAYVHE